MTLQENKGRTGRDRRHDLVIVSVRHAASLPDAGPRAFSPPNDARAKLSLLLPADADGLASRSEPARGAAGTENIRRRLTARVCVR